MPVFASRTIRTVAIAVALLVAAPVVAGADETHTIEPGDTLSALAARHGVTAAELATANGIADPNLVVVGQVLSIPSTGAPLAPAGAGSTYTVGVGDTLSGIAASFGVTAADLAAANGIADPNLIVIGASLSVPGAGSSQTGSAQATTGESAYVVQPGDSLATIAARFGTSIAALIDANGIADPNLIVAGTSLRVPVATASSNLPTELQQSSRLELMPLFDRWAAAYGIPADLFKALTWFESGWNNALVSSAGAVGIGQLMPATVDHVSMLLGERLDPNDVEDNIRMSARHLRFLLDQTGWNERQSVAAYYQGLRATNTYGVYTSSVFYVDGVLSLRSRF